MQLLRRLAHPVLVLLIGLTMTVLVNLWVARVEEARTRARFDAQASAIIVKIEDKLTTQLALLRATAGLFDASQEVTGEEFRRFVDRLRLPESNPGVLGIGYSVYAPTPARLAEAERTGRMTHGAGFRIWPDPDRARSAIVYLEPQGRRNRAAIGFDMLSEASRRSAMLAARDDGASRMSAPVKLVQEIDSRKQPGFLIYTPLYRSTARTPDSFQGWVYSPVRAHDLFGSLFAQKHDDEIVAEIHEGARQPDRLLFRSAAPVPAPILSVDRVLSFGGRRLIVTLSTSPAFAHAGPVAVQGIAALSGLVVTLLLAMFAWRQSREADRVRRLVEERTAALEAANRSLRDEATARLEAQAQVRQMQRVESLGQLTGGIAHDFNNMLAIVIGNLDLARRRIGDPERLARLLGQAMGGAERAADLTRRLLAFSRQQTLVPTRVDANALVTRMTELLDRTLGEAITLNRDLAADLWPIEVDAAELENAILNLAVNARDAMPDGGMLTIATANEQLPRADGHGLRDMAVICVTDSGTGMSDHVRERAFDPFFTTKPVGRGTGLGLSQIYGFVRQSGGEVEIRSTVGQGTTVRILLPRCFGEAGVAAPEEAGGEAPRGRASETILVVEDEEQVRAITVDVLRDLGYTVRHAADGREALGMLEQAGPPALLLTDVVMPNMDGPTLAGIVRQRWPGTRILFTTGYAPEALLEGADQGQVSAMLRKPFAAEELARRVREILDA